MCCLLIGGLGVQMMFERCCCYSDRQGSGEGEDDEAGRRGWPECRWSCLIWSPQYYTHSQAQSRVLWIQWRHPLGPSTAAGHTGTTSAEQLGFYLVRSNLSCKSPFLILSAWKIFLVVVWFNGVSDGFCALITMRFKSWWCSYRIHLRIVRMCDMFSLEHWWWTVPSLRPLSVRSPRNNRHGSGDHLIQH